MKISALFASLRTGDNRYGRRASRSTPPRRARPHLELLEDRAVPSTLTVTSNADTGVTGTLRWAVGVANTTTGDTIDILTTQPIVLTQGPLVLSSTMTIEATAGHATISGGGSTQVFAVDGASVVMEDLNIIDGHADVGGGIGSTAASALELVDCTFAGNSASGRGGAILDAGDLVASGCTFTDNSATSYGGAIYTASPFVIDVSLTECTFSNNTSGTIGGAIASAFSNNYVTLRECTFSGNTNPTLYGYFVLSDVRINGGVFYGYVRGGEVN